MELKQLDELYTKDFGVTRETMNMDLIGTLDRQLRILEVGTNSGNQLNVLQKMGFKNLYGIEIIKYALVKAKERLHNVNLIEGSATDIPFKDNFFDLVILQAYLFIFRKTILQKIFRKFTAALSNLSGASNIFPKGQKKLITAAMLICYGKRTSLISSVIIFHH